MYKAIIGSLLVLMLAAVNVYGEPELKGTPKELTDYLQSLPETVMLTADHTLDVEARQGTVSIGVVTEDSSLKKALHENQRLQKDIRQQLMAAGIAQEKIVGARFSSVPEYGLWGKKPKSYEVDNTLKVKVESEAELEAVAGVVDSYDKVFYRGMELKHEEKDSIRQQLRTHILQKLHAMKAQYEQEFGLKLAPKGFAEEIMPGPRPPMLLEKRRSVAKSYLSSEADLSVEAPSFGESNFYGRITAEYYVQQK